MKKNLLQLFTTLVAVITSVNIISCSSNEDSTNNGDSVLSNETTSVVFKAEQGIQYIFDYANDILIKSDTTQSPSLNDKITLKLRRGKHFLLWLEGLDGDKYTDEYGLHFNTQTREIKCHWDIPLIYHDVRYAQKEIEVSEKEESEYNLDYSSVTSIIEIEVTDSSPLIYSSIPSNLSKIGTISGYPNITSMSLGKTNYSLGNPWTKDVHSLGPEYSHRDDLPSIYVGDVNRYILCPLNGIDDIQLTAEIYDKNRNPIATTKLPKFSIRRGHVTTLRGPLFSGSLSDWTVEIKPYNAPTSTQPDIPNPTVGEVEAMINGINYILNEDKHTATVTWKNGSKYSGIINIPEEVKYNNNVYSVIAIGGGAFTTDTIESITIPSSVIKIGEDAFFQSKLKKITIKGEGLKSIGGLAFAQCGLSNGISIPNSVTEIGWRAFWNCGLTSIRLPNNLTEIEKEVFRANPLKEVTLPEKLEKIGEAAFYNCSFEKIKLPATIKEIGKDAFVNNYLRGIWCYAKNVPIADYSSIPRAIYLYVPRESIQLYYNSEPWKYVNGIGAIEDFEYDKY